MRSSSKLKKEQEVTGDGGSELNSKYLLLYFDNNKDIQVKEFLYRGDSRTSSEIFEKGFVARGTSPDVFSHVNPIGEHWFHDSGYISTSTSKTIAAKYPFSLMESASQELFLYEINFQKSGVDVRPHIEEAVRSNLLHPEDAEIYLNEAEIAVPRKIKASDIKGAWSVEIKNIHLSHEEVMYVRTVGDKYIPNPYYGNAIADKILKIGKTVGRGLTAVGGAIDGFRLHQAYNKGKEVDDYSGFFQEGARIIGGWSGAFALGKVSAAAGAAIFAPTGPIGMAVGSLGMGLAGSVAGYTAGGAIAEKGYKHVSDDSIASLSFISQAKAHEQDLCLIENIEQSSIENNKMSMLGAESLRIGKKSTSIKKEKTSVKNRQRPAMMPDAALKKIHLLHKKMNLIMDAFSQPDMDQFQNEPRIMKIHEDLLNLKSLEEGSNAENYQEEIFNKELELKRSKAEVMAKRLKFTDNLRKTGHALSGASNVLGILGEEKLAHEISVIGASTLAVLENGAALLGIGLLAGSINPLAAFSNIAAATFNIVNLFKPKPNTENQILSIILPYLSQLSRNIDRLTSLTQSEFNAVKHQLHENHLISLEKFSELADNQRNMLETLNRIYFEMKGSFASQHDKLRKILSELLSIEYKIHSQQHHQDIENLKEYLRLILENTKLEFNELSNKLEHIGKENSHTHQLDDIFKLPDNARPIEYFQLANYFSGLLKSSNHLSQAVIARNPLTVVYACIASILLNLNNTPNPRGTLPSQRILVRDILHLKNYQLLLNDIHTLMAAAGNVDLVELLIKQLGDSALSLAEAMDKRINEIETRYTQEKQMQIDQSLALYRQELSTQFNSKFEVNDYGWFRGTKTYTKRWHEQGRRKGEWFVTNNVTPYTHEEDRNNYFRETEKRIAEQRSMASKMIRDNTISAKNNHLFAFNKSTLSLFHGVGYIQPKDGRLPLLPAPDPLLSFEHPQFNDFIRIKEASCLGLGFIEFIYEIKAEENKFILEIYFNFFAKSNIAENSKLKIATIEFNDYQPKFYKPQESVWYYWVGSKIAPEERGKTKHWSTPGIGRKCITFDQALHGHGTGHNGGEFECTEFSIMVPQEFIDITPKINDFNSINLNLTVVESNMTIIEKLKSDAYVLFQGEVNQTLRNDLDYTATHELGRKAYLFEEAYRKLYGILSFAYFDLMQDKSSELYHWFNTQAVSIKHLKESPSCEKLENLKQNLDDLMRIVQKYSYVQSSFDLLHQVSNILDDFVEIYEPNAIKNNEQLPPNNHKDTVADKLTELLVNMVDNLILIAPAISEEVITKTLLESRNDQLDEYTKFEIQQRISEKVKQKKTLQLPSTEQIVNALGAPENTPLSSPVIHVQSNDPGLLNSNCLPMSNVEPIIKQPSFPNPQYQCSLEGNLTLLQVIGHWVGKWLPWNKDKLISDNDKEELMSICYDLKNLEKRQHKILQGPIRNYPIASELSGLSRVLRGLDGDISDIRKSWIASDSQLKDIKYKFERVKEELSKFSKISRQLAQYEEKAREGAKEGEEWVICCSSDGELTVRIEKPKTYLNLFSEMDNNVQPVGLNSNLLSHFSLFKPSQQPILVGQSEQLHNNHSICPVR